MRKFMMTVSAAALALGMLASSALADDDTSNPAVNSNECAEAGGEFTQEGRGNRMVRTCTVGDGEDTVLEGQPASHRTQAWTVDLLIPGGATIYTFQPSVGFGEQTVGGDGDPVVIACYNHNDIPIDDFENNDNCVPA